MTIKQAEQQTGIAKQNIRYYESQGLLRPARGEYNAYRSYSAEDLRSLKTIKMLRRLGVPVPVVRQVLRGELSLGEAVRGQQETLEAQRTQLDVALRLCAQLQGESLQTLNVDAVLARMDEAERTGGKLAEIWNDFKLVSAEEGRSITFSPDTMIGDKREFTDALLKFATQNGQTLVITKESMYPEFTLDCVPYTALRSFGRFGAVITCTPVRAPDSAFPVPPLRRRLLRAAYYFLWFALAFVLMFLWLSMLGIGSVLTRLLITATIVCMAVCSWYFFYRARP